MTRDFVELLVRAGTPCGGHPDAATRDCNPGGSVAAWRSDDPPPLRPGTLVSRNATASAGPPAAQA
jgi:hypothetical protein